VSYQLALSSEQTLTDHKFRDYALLDGYLKTAFNYTKKASEIKPTILEYGGPFFESYQTFANTKFIHGFNLAKQGDGYRRNLYDGAIVACNALKGKLLYWELGNEPDMYSVQAGNLNANVRPKSWNDAAFASEVSENLYRIIPRN
jgi:hypothetical protein